MCDGLEPIKKRFPFYPFLCQEGLIAWFLKKREKATRLLGKRPHLPESGGEGSQGHTWQAGLGLHVQDKWALQSPCRPPPPSGTPTAQAKAVIGRRKERTIPAHISLPATSPNQPRMLCALLEMERATSTAKNLRLEPAGSLEIQKGWSGLSLPRASGRKEVRAAPLDSWEKDKPHPELYPA